MTLTQQQKALIENVIMVVEEHAGTQTECYGNQHYNDTLFYAVRRVQTMLRQESLEGKYYLRKKLVIAIAEVIGKEVRRARYYKNMTAEKIIEALDIAFKVLKRNVK